jgi:uncharacterized glyoxalase superfamily protein PhnB
MSDAWSIASEVEVTVDAATAFTAFTDEMDLWWRHGPINYYESWRTVAKKCEPGVGGRLLEVFDESTGEGREVGRITRWEPGARLGWQSTDDDVEIEVTFDPIAAGTLVRVEARVPKDGHDRGGSSWVGVTPGWFGTWCAKRDTASHEPSDLGRLGLAVYYAKPATAARWLANAFGFEGCDPLPEDENEPWIEFQVANNSLMVFKLDGSLPENAPATHVPWVFVDDVDAHFASAQAGGAMIVEPIHEHGYRAYTAEDLEGHRWTFAQARPTQH